MIVFSLLQGLFLKHASGCFFVSQKEEGNCSPEGGCWIETSPGRQEAALSGSGAFGDLSLSRCCPVKG